MAYWKAEHTKDCKDQSRYLITWVHTETVHRKGAIISNTDRGNRIDRRCASCGSPAEWVD